IQFYDNMAKAVKKLILRNRKRLQRELSESKELMALISKSTVKDLSAEEKKKMQHQLIDIFKSIPSLAIFLLPGGAVLLPIFIKLIPQLLPSSFDDNRIEKKK
ncbi:MAG: LETM1 domain-containing protein, partial [Eudoraea sp.]|nr:LETM1 domain-containing protein [Eudoraea sp.]